MQDIMAFQAIVIVCGTIGFVASLRFVLRFLEMRRDRPLAPLVDDAMQQRLDRIETIVETTALEVERISEGNRFMAKLLAERTGAIAVPNRPERVITPH